MDINKTISQSHSWVLFYRKNAKSATIDKLLECKTVLTTNNYFLAEMLCDLKGDYNTVYYSRKIEFAKAKDRFVNKENCAVNKADYKAIIETEEIIKTEGELETTAFRLETMIKQFESICQDITQRISVLKKEINNTASQ